MKNLSYFEVGCRWVDANEGLPVEGSEVQVALISESVYHGKYPNAYHNGDRWKYANDSNIVLDVTHWRYIENPYGSGVNGVAMELAYRRYPEQDVASSYRRSGFFDGFNKALDMFGIDPKDVMSATHEDKASKKNP